MKTKMLDANLVSPYSIVMALDPNALYSPWMPRGGYTTSGLNQASSLHSFPSALLTTFDSGEVANRIVTAGDPARVRRFAAFLDESPKPFELVSARGFVTITGRYKGVPVSLCAIGMGEYPCSYLREEIDEGD